MLSNLKRFYTDHLIYNILPFWLKYSLDYEYEGYFTYFNNDGTKLISADKYTWAQGRMIYVWALLSNFYIFSDREKSQFKEHALSGAEFIMRHCIREDGSCYFSTNRWGHPVITEKSIYADCFAVIGLAGCAGISEDDRYAKTAFMLFKKAAEKILQSSFSSLPYPSPNGYSHIGASMIMLNTAQIAALNLSKLGAEAVYYIKKSQSICSNTSLQTI